MRRLGLGGTQPKASREGGYESYSDNYILCRLLDGDRGKSRMGPADADLLHATLWVVSDGEPERQWRPKRSAAVPATAVAAFARNQ